MSSSPIADVAGGDALLQLSSSCRRSAPSPSPIRTTGSRSSRFSSSASSPAGCRRRPAPRAQEALDRRNELTRLFDLTRDILLTTEREGALPAIARHVARRFELDTVAICVPARRRRLAGPSRRRRSRRHWRPRISIARSPRAPGTIEFDARTRTYGGHREIASDDGAHRSCAGAHRRAAPSALLATGGRPLEPGTRDAVAGIVAIALERSQFLDERRGAELSRQRAELSSALLASLSHDLRTPLTAIRTAVSNLDSAELPEDSAARAGAASPRTSSIG